MHMQTYICLSLCLSCMCTHIQNIDPPPSQEIKIIYISESALSYKINPQALFTWGQDGLQHHAEDDTMKNINYHKNISPSSCPWRCMRKPDKERRKLRGEKKEEEREEQSQEKKVEGVRKRERNCKQERRKRRKKSSLSGFGNSDSWGPFVLITAEQRFCRY